MYEILSNKFFRVVLPNLVIIGTFMLITLMILDYYNPLMGFLNRDMSVGFLVVYWTVVALFAVTFAARMIMKIFVAKKEGKLER